MNRILFNIPNLDSSGVPVIWLIKMREFQQRHYEVYLSRGSHLIRLDHIQDVYTFNRTRFRDFPKPKKFHSKYQYIIFALNNMLTQLKLLKKIVSKRIDIIYSPSSVLDFLIFPFFVKLLKPNIFWATVFDNTVPLRGEGSPLIHFLAWTFFQLSIPIIKKADQVFAITPILKNYLIMRGLSVQSVLTTGCGVEQDLISKSKPNSKYRYDGLYIGRIHSNKGIFDLLRVMELLTQKNKGIRLALMGNGDQTTENRFKSEIARLNLNKNVTLLGYISGQKKYEYLASCRSFWYLSYDDSFGVALLEAVSMGKKSFAYDLPPFRYLYKKNEVLVHPIGDYQSVAKNIQAYLSSKIPKTSKSSIDHFKWTWASIVSKEDMAIKDKLSPGI